MRRRPLTLPLLRNGAPPSPARGEGIGGGGERLGWRTRRAGPASARGCAARRTRGSSPARAITSPTSPCPAFRTWHSCAARSRMAASAPSARRKVPRAACSAPRTLPGSSRCRQIPASPALSRPTTRRSPRGRCASSASRSRCALPPPAPPPRIWRRRSTSISTSCRRSSTCWRRASPARAGARALGRQRLPRTATEAGRQVDEAATHAPRSSSSARCARRGRCMSPLEGKGVVAYWDDRLEPARRLYLDPDAAHHPHRACGLPRASTRPASASSRPMSAAASATSACCSRRKSASPGWR